MSLDAQYVVEVLGYEPTVTHVEQMEVLLQVFAKFVERNAQYKDLWRNGGPRDSANHIESKAARIQHFTRMIADIDWSLSEVDAPVDDAIDLINYAVFYIRNVAGARLTNEEIDAMGCELRERRWPGNPWPCNHGGTVRNHCPVHGSKS